MTDDIWRDSVQSLLDGLGGTDPEWGPGTVDYWLDELMHEVDVMYGGQRVRVVVYIDELEPALAAEATTWAAAERDRSPAVLEVWTDKPSDITYLTATFERPLRGHDWYADPLKRHVAEIWHAWEEHRPIAIDSHEIVRFGDPIELEPQSAWLLVGSAASLVTDQEIVAMQNWQRVGMYDFLWTGAKQTKAGDLLLIYYTAPHKVVRFVARAASDAFFARDIPVNADEPVADEQWWIPLTPLIEIQPIDFRQVQTASDGHLILKGRSGHYLRPEVIDALSLAALNATDRPDVTRVVRRPTGLADLPDPNKMSFDEWRVVAPGALRIEKDVSTYLVEPLLRLAGLDRWKREFRVGRGSADYAVLDDDGPAAVIEVKLAAIPTKDLTQLKRYTSPLRCSGILFDALRLYLVSADGTKPLITLERQAMSTSDLAMVAEHLGRTNQHEITR